MAKSKKSIVVLTPEQEAERRLAFALAELRRDLAIAGNRMPTVQFKVGQEVRIGHIDKTVVKEILDDGRILRVHCYSVNKPGSQNVGKVSSNEDRIIPWFDCSRYYTDAEIKKLEKFSYFEEMRLNFAQRDVEGLLYAYYNVGIDLNPDYQRGFVWSLDDKVALIDSIFNHIDIGKFVLIHREYAENQPGYEILDGKQRLSALLDFFEGRFAYRGKKFFDLHPSDANFFERYPISWAQTNVGITQEMKYRYFLKLNTTGKPQDPKHIAYVRSLCKMKPE